MQFAELRGPQPAEARYSHSLIHAVSAGRGPIAYHKCESRGT